MTTFSAAAIQMRSGLSPAANVVAADEMIRAAAADGADYVLTPEMTTVLDGSRARLMSVIADEENDPSLAGFRRLAAELGIFLHIGSMAIKLAGEAVADRAFVIGPDGGIVADYDKIHMFDVDLGDGERYRESRLFRAGAKATVVRLPFAGVGLTICYDVRFPHLYRSLAKAGASLLAIPAAFTRTTGQAHWSVLVRARAIENGAFVIAAAQGGLHEDGRQTYGHSMIVDPWGKVMAELGEDPGFILAEIDVAASEAARARIPSLDHDSEFEVSAPASVATLDKVG